MLYITQFTVQQKDDVSLTLRIFSNNKRTFYFIPKYSKTFENILHFVMKTSIEKRTKKNKKNYCKTIK